MLFGGHRRVEVTEREYNCYQAILARLEHAMNAYVNEADIAQVLDYVRNGARHGATARHAMGNTKRLLDHVKQETDSLTPQIEPTEEEQQDDND